MWAGESLLMLLVKSLPSLFFLSIHSWFWDCFMPTYLCITNHNSQTENCYIFPEPLSGFSGIFALMTKDRSFTQELSPIHSFSLRNPSEYTSQHQEESHWALREWQCLELMDWEPNTVLDEILSCLPLGSDRMHFVDMVTIHLLDNLQGKGTQNSLFHSWLSLNVRKYFLYKKLRISHKSVSCKSQLPTQTILVFKNGLIEKSPRVV